jgi:nucleoside 2-deoxyribosyltransferase
MKLYISHSLTPTDTQVAVLLSRQAQAKGISVESSRHQTILPASTAVVVRQAITGCDFVIAIVSLDSQYASDVQRELGTAAALKKPTLALVERGVRLLRPIAGVQYVEFVRSDLGPALTHISNILEGRKNQESLTQWVVGGGLALLALYLLSKSEE